MSSPFYYLSILINKMCDTCLECAHEYDLQFNPLKCQLTKYGSGTDCQFHFDGIQVKKNKKVACRPHYWSWHSPGYG